MNVNFFSDLKFEYYWVYYPEILLQVCLMGGAMKHFLKKLPGHEIFRSMASWAYKIFFEKFVKPSYILNVRSLMFLPSFFSTFFCYCSYIDFTRNQVIVKKSPPEFDQYYQTGSRKLCQNCYGCA